MRTLSTLLRKLEMDNDWPGQCREQLERLSRSHQHVCNKAIYSTWLYYRCILDIHNATGMYRCIPKKRDQVTPHTAADKKCSTKLIAYPYHVNKFLICGDEYTLATADGAVQPVAGEWHTLTSYIKMNTAGTTFYHPAQLSHVLLKPKCYALCCSRPCALLRSWL